jgi:hypothetical protein
MRRTCVRFTTVQKVKSAFGFTISHGYEIQEALGPEDMIFGDSKSRLLQCFLLFLLK